MNKLIDADALIQNLSVDPGECPGCPEPEFLNDLIEILKAAPVIDAVPVRHGKWLEDYPDDDWGYRCSECGHLELYQFDYCSSCGAKMDGKDGDHHDSN